MSLKEVKTISIGSEEYEVVDIKARPVKNVEEMKALDNLKSGDIIKTIGYYSANDGGAATYLIREKVESDVEDNGLIHFINETIVAEMIVDDYVNVRQFGVIDDNETDQTEKIQACLNCGAKTVYFPNGTYIISNALYPKTNIYGESKDKTIIYFPTQDPSNILTNSIFYLLEVNNIEIKNICLEGNFDKDNVSSDSSHGHCIATKHCENLDIHDVYFKNPSGDGIYLGGDTDSGVYIGKSKYINIYNNIFENPKRCAVSFIHCDVINVYKNVITKNYVHVGVFDLEPNNSNQHTTNIKIEDNICDTDGAFVKVFYSSSNLNNPKLLKINGNKVKCSLFYFGNNDSNTEPTIDYVEMMNNEITDTTESMMYNIKKLLMMGNTFNKQFKLHTTNNATITDNKCVGIVLEKVDGINIFNNHIERKIYTSSGNCITILSGSNIYITNNKLEKVRAGIRIQLNNDSSNIYIKNNFIKTSKWGLYFVGTSYVLTNMEADNNTIVHDVQEDTADDVSFVDYYDNITKKLNKNNFFKYNSIGKTKQNKIGIVGEYLQNTNITVQTDDKGSYYVKGWLCVNADNQTWIEDKLYV